MKKILKYIFNTLLFVSSLALVSCSNILQDEEQKSSNKITLTANIDFGDSSRKITPMDYSLYSSLKYELVATCNTNNDYSTKGNFTSSTIEMELIAANWSFELTAYDAANIPILRSSENKNIDVTKDTVLNFKMVGVTNGTLIYDFKFSSRYETLNFDDNPIIIFDIYKYSGSIEDSITENNHFSFSNLEYTNEISKEEGYDNYWNYERKFTFSLSEGTYIVICRKAERPNTGEEDSFELPDPDPSTVTSSFFFQELVEIKAGLTTKSGYDNINSALPKYKITLHTNGGSLNLNDEYGNPISYTNIRAYDCYSYTFYDTKRINNVLPTPDKTNNIFLGWYSDAKFTKPFENPFGDGIPLLDASANLLGNFEVYAKWLPLGKEKPEVLFYELSEYLRGENKVPNFSNNWNVNFEMSDNAFVFDVVQKNDKAYYLQTESGTTSLIIKNSNNEIEREVSLLDFPDIIVRLAFDAEQNKTYILFRSLETPENRRHKYTITTYDNNTNTLESTPISIGDELSVTGVCEYAQVKGFGVNNGTIWLSFYNLDEGISDPDPAHSSEGGDYYPQNDYINLIYICTPDGDGYSVVEKKAPDFFACLPGSLSSLKNYSWITDFSFYNNKIYATVKSGYDSPGFTDDMQIDGQTTFVHFGGIIEIDSITYIARSLFSYNPENTKNFNIPYTEYISGELTSGIANYQYMGIKSKRDLTCLAGPTKIIAIKEDELVMIDEGAFAWVDKDKGRHIDVNRIVAFDLQTNSIKYACPIINTPFTEDNGNYVGSRPLGFDVASSIEPFIN